MAVAADAHSDIAAFRPGAVFPMAGARRWVNLADRGDLVAIPCGGVGKRFRDAQEDPGVSVHWLDFPTAANYLNTEALTTLLRV